MKFKLWLDLPDKTMTDNPLMVMEFEAADLSAAIFEVESEYPYNEAYYSKVLIRDDKVIWNGRHGDKLILNKILEFEEV